MRIEDVDTDFEARDNHRQSLLVVGALVALAGLTLVAALVINQRRNVVPLVAITAAAQTTTVETALVTPMPSPRTLDPYIGLGTWVDGFDYSLPYTGPTPPVNVAEVDAMAAAGVRTMYLQASRLSGRSPDVLEDRWTITALLQAARRNDIAVVAWYLPKWVDTDEDRDRLAAIAQFEALGLRFDGLAMDIEWNTDELEPAERSRRLVQLSTEWRALAGDEPLGAIVLPPVLTDVVNTDFWPEFPWEEIAPLYDVWLPMSYWSFRREEYDSGYLYNTESTQRLREHLADPEALVHAIGGIGGVDGIDDPENPEEPLAHLDQFDDLALSVDETGAIGVSVYDWVTLEPAARERLAELFG